ISTVSVFPASTFLPTLNPIEPPWYGPVCPVVWEGWRREVSPYPDRRRVSPIAPLFTADEVAFVKAAVARLIPADDLGPGALEADVPYFIGLSDTKDGFFADPVYGGNKDMVGWKLVGFPGVAADYSELIARHNQPYPVEPVDIRSLKEADV